MLVIAWLGWVALLPGLFRLKKSTRQTTLVTAIRWAWAAAIAYGISLGSLTFAHFPQVLNQQALYWTGIIALCPLIAVLGAQRPGVRVWNGFVLVPLVAVLGWPALTVWFSGDPPAPLSIETPTALGIAVVAVMGLGNYVLIPRWSLTVVFFAAAIAFTLLPLTMLVDLSPVWHLAAYPCLGLAALAGWCGSRTGERHSDPLEQMWADFRDRFGLVWAARIRERVNASAEQEKWCWRLEMHGFQRIEAAETKDDGVLNEADTRARTEHTLNWLLRRFVDDQLPLSPRSMTGGIQRSS